jgi:HNH endonuclease
MLRAFDRRPRKGEVARHLDDNFWNNRLANLKWGTQKDNVADAIRNGALGKDSPHAKAVSVAARRNWKNGVYDEKVKAQRGLL